jgi:hypothetical protein
MLMVDVTEINCTGNSVILAAASYSYCKSLTHTYEVLTSISQRKEFFIVSFV